MPVPERRSGDIQANLDYSAWIDFCVILAGKLDHGLAVTEADWRLQRKRAIDDSGLEYDTVESLLNHEVVMSTYHQKVAQIRPSIKVDELTCLRHIELIMANVKEIVIECKAFVVDEKSGQTYVNFKVTVIHYPGLGGKNKSEYPPLDFFPIHKKIFKGESLDLSDFFAFKKLSNVALKVFEVIDIDFDQKRVTISN